MGTKDMILAWGAAIFVVFLTALAIFEPIIYRGLFDEAPPVGALDAAAIFAAMIGLMALGVAAFGYAAYRLLQGQITSRAVAEARPRAYWAAAWTLNDLGYFAFLEYDAQTRNKSANLEVEQEVRGKRLGAPDKQLDIDARRRLETAIGVTANAESLRAYMNESEPDQETLVCRIVNNLAYYLAEREYKQDRRQAESFADWLESKLSLPRFQEHVSSWTDTIEKARTCEWRVQAPA